MGIAWVAIEVAWHDNTKTSSHNLIDGALAVFAPELEAAGIEVWVWGFPSPDRISEFVETIADAYKAAPQVRGVIADPEAPFYGSAHSAALEDLISQLQDLGRPVGVTSYGAPYFHPGFPWEAIAGADFGQPQIYSELGADYPAKADQAWRDLGFDIVIPLNGASSAHTGEAMTLQANQSETKDGGIGWWNYRHLLLAEDGGRAARVEAVRNFEVG
jgi:hypothetical protein